MKFSRIALLGAATTAVAQRHAHRHAAHHAVRNAAPIDARSDVFVTTTAPGPIVTVYELNGEDIPAADVEQGLKDGKYILIGGEVSTVAPTTPSTSTTSSTPTPTPTVEAAKFFEKASSSSEAPTSTYVAPTTSSTPAPVSTSAAATVDDSSSSSDYSGDAYTKYFDVDSTDVKGLSTTFENNTHSCDTFPLGFGAIPVNYLGLDGWTGIQNLADFTFGYDNATKVPALDISLATSGGCVPNAACSYACPAGYQKSQWLASQGETGSSIGGLFCSSDNKLLVSRNYASEIKLCTQGSGGVTVHNKLTGGDEDVISICRTDYPGSEAETIPLGARPGSTYPLTSPVSSEYFQWTAPGTTTLLGTSAQYYFNPKGVLPHEACKWDSNTTPKNTGNWAPVNAGAGKGADGLVYVSLFPNHPTNMDGVLDYDIVITGNVAANCAYKGGQFYTNGKLTPDGCTVSFNSSRVYDQI